jgi:hypothetical protein
MKAFFSHIGSAIANAYYWFLWYVGFYDTDGDKDTSNDREKITFMLRRCKERMKLLWWVVSLATLIGIWTVCLLVSWWYLPLEAFFLWLFVHVLYVYVPPDNIWSSISKNPKVVIPPKEELFHDVFGGNLQ